MKVPFLKLIVRKIRKSIAIVEEGDTVTHSGGLAVGKYVIWKGTQYKVTTAMSYGETISGSKLSAVSDGIANELNSNITELTANDLNEVVDLAGYSSGEYYVFPKDGYIRVFCSISSSIIYRLYGETGTRFIYNQVGDEERQTLFVKKGMRYECRAKTGSYEVEFYGLV